MGDVTQERAEDKTPRVLRLNLEGNDRPKVRLASDETEKPKPPEPIQWKERADKKFEGELKHNEFGYTVKLVSKDKEGKELEEVRTEFSDGKTPTRVYKKDAEGWYQELEGGKKVRMQGDLRVDSANGKFTQVLRRDMDKGDTYDEATRTMDRDGTDRIHRTDKTESIFNHDSKGNPTEWTELDAKGKETGHFKAEVQSDGQIKWTSTDGKKEVRWNHSVEDNGNVTWSDKARTTTTDGAGRQLQIDEKRHVETSGGDRVVDGDGANYTFNYRGDIQRIKYHKPKGFEFNSVVDEVHIGYRGDTRIVDRLVGFLGGNQTIDMRRLGKTDGRVADNAWQLYAANGQPMTHNVRTRQGNVPVYYQGFGDYTVNNGEISTTEKNVDNIKVKEGDKEITPDYIRWTYTANPATGENTERGAKKEAFHPRVAYDPKDTAARYLDDPAPGEDSAGATVEPAKPGTGTPEPTTPDSPTPRRRPVRGAPFASLEVPRGKSDGSAQDELDQALQRQLYV